jgi:hypothetical protein
MEKSYTLLFNVVPVDCCTLVVAEREVHFQHSLVLLEMISPNWTPLAVTNIHPQTVLEAW